MKCGNRRVGENHSTSCGASVRAKPKARLRALGSHTPLIGAAEQRLVPGCSNISLAANKTQSPLRGSKQISIVTQGSQTRLGLSADRCSAARRVVTSHEFNRRSRGSELWVTVYPRLAKPRLGLSADRCSAARCVVTSRGVNVPRIQSPLPRLGTMGHCLPQPRQPSPWASCSPLLRSWLRRTVPRRDVPRIQSPLRGSEKNFPICFPRPRHYRPESFDQDYFGRGKRTCNARSLSCFWGGPP